MLGMGPRLFGSVHSIGRSSDAGHVFFRFIYLCIVHNAPRDDLVTEAMYISLTFGELARIKRIVTPVVPGSMEHASGYYLTQ